MHCWGEYPTLIDPSCSRYTSRAYVPVTSKKGFDQRCEHERLCLLFSDRKRAASQRNFSSVRDIRRDDVIMSYEFPTGINLWVMLLLLIALDPSRPIIPAPVTTGSTLTLLADVS